MWFLSYVIILYYANETSNNRVFSEYDKCATGHLILNHSIIRELELQFIEEKNIPQTPLEG